MDSFNFTFENTDRYLTFSSSTEVKIEVENYENNIKKSIKVPIKKKNGDVIPENVKLLDQAIFLPEEIVPKENRKNALIKILKLINEN